MEKVVEDVWNSKDKEVRAVITLSFSKSVAFNIMNETMTPNKMNALRDMYEKSSTSNKVFLMRELFTIRMNNESSVTVHINNIIQLCLDYHLWELILIMRLKLHCC